MSDENQKVTLINSNVMDGNKENIFNCLKNILYPDASDSAIKMLIDYCKASKLDPLTKPFHIIKMNSYNKYTKQYEQKETIMAGIVKYRIDAVRTGEYAGMTEPEFGNIISCKFGNREFQYPEWCKITVKRLINNNIVSFTAKEFWIENYATKSKDDLYPNTMWEKRKYGQISKCTEAQALRKAFPEAIGGLLTAEEMEGKELIINPDNNLSYKKDISSIELTSEDDDMGLSNIKDIDSAYSILEDIAKNHGTEKLLISWSKLPRDICFEIKKDNNLIDKLKLIAKNHDELN